MRRYARRAWQGRWGEAQGIGKWRSVGNADGVWERSMNMRAVLAVVCLALVVLLPGCIVQSLHPLYAEKDLVFEPGLVGVWEQGSEGGTVLTFERAEDTTYRLAIEENEETARFVVGLVRLGDGMFLDFAPEPLDESGDSASSSSTESEEQSDDQSPGLPLISIMHFVPVHSFWRIWLEGDELRMRLLNVDWLYEQIEEGTIVIEHEPMGEEDYALLLTADTEDLQKLLREHADDPDVFVDPGRFERRVPAGEGGA
jgi:hypothetical protein